MPTQAQSPGQLAPVAGPVVLPTIAGKARVTSMLLAIAGGATLSGTLVKPLALVFTH